jgi:hypothetical protein
LPESLLELVDDIAGIEDIQAHGSIAVLGSPDRLGSEALELIMRGSVYLHNAELRGHTLTRMVATVPMAFFCR